MKKLLKYCLGLLAVAFAAILSVSNIDIEAAVKYRVKTDTLKEGKAVSGKQRESVYSNGNTTVTFKVFKITVPNDGYITIKDMSEESYNTMYLYKSAEDIEAYYVNNQRPNKYLAKTNYKTKTNYLPVEKGTYYFMPSDSGNYNFKYTFTKTNIDYTNYTRKAAQALKAGKDVTIVEPENRTANLWFSIKLTKKKNLNVNFKVLNGDIFKIRVYDKDGESYDLVEGDDGEYTSAKQLAKGTYYVKVEINSYGNDFQNGVIYKLSCK